MQRLFSFFFLKNGPRLLYRGGGRFLFLTAAFPARPFRTEQGARRPQGGVYFFSLLPVWFSATAVMPQPMPPTE